MNEEIHSIIAKRKKAMNELESDNSPFPWALYSVYKKLRTIHFPYLLVNLSKQRYISSDQIYKYLHKLIR